MKKIALIGILTLLIGVCAFKLSSSWKVIDEQVSITFELPEEGTKGTISGLKATIEFDEKDLRTAKMSASVDVKSLNTGTPKKDAHLMTADFFDAEKYPTMSFEATLIKTSETGFVAVGNLHVKDAIKPIEIPFTFTDDGKGNAAFKGTMTFLAGDFGIMKKSDTGKDKVVVTVSVPVKR